MPAGDDPFHAHSGASQGDGQSGASLTRRQARPADSAACVGGKRGRRQGFSWFGSQHGMPQGRRATPRAGTGSLRDRLGPARYGWHLARKKTRRWRRYYPIRWQRHRIRFPVDRPPLSVSVASRLSISPGARHRDPALADSGSEGERHGGRVPPRSPGGRRRRVRRGARARLPNLAGRGGRAAQVEPERRGGSRRTRLGRHG